MIVRKIPYESQPQSPTQIDWSNPITNGLVAASIAGGSQGDLTVYTAPNNYTMGVGREGVEAVTTTASTQYFETTGSNRISGFPFTAVAMIRPAALVTQAVFNVYTSATEYHELYLTNGGAIIQVSTVASVGASATASAAYAANDIFVVGGRVASATDRSVWKNGALLASNTTSKSPSASVNNRWGLWNGTTERFGGGWYVRLAWNRALSDIEMAEITKNPWQVFEPQKRYIPVSVASSGAYTLVADVGSYTYTGQAATLLRNKVLSASAGSYTITGQSSVILKSKVLTADNGTYSYSGQTATITYTPAGNYTLTAATGSYSYTGQSATIKKSKVISAGHGVYTYTGQGATVAYSGSNTITLKAGSWIRYRTI